MENLEQKEIDRYWSDGAENYSWIIDDELSSFRVKKWTKKITENISSSQNQKSLTRAAGQVFLLLY